MRVAGLIGGKGMKRATILEKHGQSCALLLPKIAPRGAHRRGSAVMQQTVFLLPDV